MDPDVDIQVSVSGVSDEDVTFADGATLSPRESTSTPAQPSRLPPRPPSSTSSKSPRSGNDQLTSGSGHTKSPAATSGFASGPSVSTPSASPSSLTSGKSPQPNLESSLVVALKGEDAIAKLRKEIGSLREKFALRQKDWDEVRNFPA